VRQQLATGLTGTRQALQQHTADRRSPSPAIPGRKVNQRQTLRRRTWYSGR